MQNKILKTLFNHLYSLSEKRMISRYYSKLLKKYLKKPKSVCFLNKTAEKSIEIAIFVKI
jgi:hypothetical protein